MRSCRICGCTDDRACNTGDGPCYWVENDLCSRCADAMDGVAAGPELAPAGEAGEGDVSCCPASPVPAPHRVLWTDQQFGYCVRCRAGFHAGG